MSPPDEANGNNTHQTNPVAASDKVQLCSKGLMPKLLKKSAGGESCCIFRIPQSLARINHASYEPKIVSIGPYHHGKRHFQMIQEHKHLFLELFVAKTQENGVGLQELVDAVSAREEDIRESYSEDLVEYDRQKLIEMMVLDGCFILVMFLVVAREVVYTVYDDPIFSMPWILPTIRSDLLLLENQVPLFLLQTLLETSKLVTSMSLNEIAFEFFSYSIHKPEEFWAKHRDLEAKHLLDLIRKTFIPISSQKTPKQSFTTIICCSKGNSEAETSTDCSPFLEFILSAKKLHLRGIKFEPRMSADTFLDIRLMNGVLQIPPVTLDDFLSSFLLNCIAFEQLYKHSKSYMTSYVAFMGCLMNNKADVMFLNEKGIIENYFGTANEVSRFFKNTGKEVPFDISLSYLSEVFEGVNEYTSKGLHVQWAGFKHTHFDSPWTCLSSCAALTLLVLTLIQAFFAAYSYFNSPQSKVKGTT